MGFLVFMLYYYNLYSLLLSLAPIIPRFLEWGLGWMICIIDLNEKNKPLATATTATATIGFLEDDIASITFSMVYAYVRRRSYS